MVLDNELIKLISYFEAKTKSRVRDAFYDQNGKLTFMVEEGDLGKALGKGAKNLKELESKLNKPIRVTEWKTDKKDLIRSFVSPLEILSIDEQDDGIIVLRGKDERTRGLLIGKQARNLRNLEWMMRRYDHDIPEIKVIEHAETDSNV